MKRFLIILLSVLCFYSCFSQNKVKPTWESLNERGYPQWFDDAKLGIFIHWGLYSVPAYASKEGYGEWFYRGLMLGDSGRKSIMSFYADTTKPIFDQYKELTKYWHAELWNPDDWAQLFKKAGAKYVLLVTKHHDGYCLWDSPQQPDWNSTTSGPHRNIVEELTNSVRNSGLRMGFYYSLPEWTNSKHIWMQDPDNEIDDYVENYMIPQFKDLVSRYKPDVIFSDGDWNNTAEQFHSKELISWYYNIVGADAIVNNRWGNGTKHGFLTPEYSAGITNTEVPWAECRGLGRSFGLNRNEDLTNYLTDKELIQHFVELVAHGGGMTLNVGPNADGTIPLIQQERLLNLGKWLEINGEAVYGSKPILIKDQYVNKKAKFEAESIYFDWVRNAPLREVSTDSFNVVLSADIVIPQDGDFTFYAAADDEVLVYKMLNNEVSDTLLYANKNFKTGKEQITLHLSKNDTLKLKSIFRENDLEASVSLKWSCNGGTPTPVKANWQGEIYWKKASRCFTVKDNNIYIFEFERPTNDAPIIINNFPKIRKNSIITLLGTDKVLKWKQKGNFLVVDFRELNQRVIDSLDNVWVLKIEQ